MSETTLSTEAKDATYALKGLEADNLLAFLALLGLLRALDTARPEWEARGVWHGMPPQAELRLVSGVDRDETIVQIDAGLRMLGEAYVSDGPLFDRPNLKYAPNEFRELALRARSERNRARLVAALASDGATRGGGQDEVEPTPLCTMSGQGHQCFLSRLGAMLTPPDPLQANESGGPKRRKPRRSAKAKGSSPLEKLAEVLFEPWRYEDRTDSFRWDPIEDRRYAYQFGNPSESANKIGTVSGANRLAAFGLAILTSAPKALGLATVGVFGGRRERTVCWPLVSVPTSLHGHVGLLAHPYLGDEQRAPELAGYGVLAVARSQRYGVPGAAGTYFNFTRARVQYL